jgi:hypothetical protein
MGGDNLNRQERREKERKLSRQKKKSGLESWKKNWTYEQAKYFMQEVGKEVDKINDTTEMILDTCYVAAISDNVDLSILDLEKIVIEANAYMDETKQYLNENKGDYFMKIDDETMKKIRNEISNHIKNGDIKSESLNQLKKDYKLTGPILNNIWLEEKEKFPKLAVNKHAPQPTQNQPISEQKESTNAITPKEENKSVEKQIDKQKQDTKSIFEVVEKKLKFKGEFYNYEKDKSGLKVGAEFFKSLEEVEAFRIRETEEFEKMVEEIRQAFAYEG